MKPNKAISNAWKTLFGSAERGLCVPKQAVLFREPTSETWLRQHKTWQPKGYYQAFCAHDRSYFVPCQQCKRDKNEALQRLWSALGKGRNGEK